MADEPEWCETCHGPIWGKSLVELDLSHLAHWIWMRLPMWLAFNRVGMAILPWAGTHAFGCSCHDKNHSARFAS